MSQFFSGKKHPPHNEAAYKSQHTITAFNLSKYHQINRQWPVLIDQWSSPFNLQLIFFIRQRHSQSGIIWGRVITFLRQCTGSCLHPVDLTDDLHQSLFVVGLLEISTNKDFDKVKNCTRVFSAKQIKRPKIAFMLW